MKIIEEDWSTLIELEGDEPKDICKLGQGNRCCAWLVVSSEGFECLRMDYPNNTSIDTRIRNGTIAAKGEGGWDGCPWKEANDA